MSRITKLKSELRREVESASGPLVVIIKPAAKGRTGRVFLRRKRGKKNLAEMLIYDSSTPLQQVPMPLEEK